MSEKFEDLGGQPSSTPLPATLRGCGQNPCLGHPLDRHVCPWRDSDDGKVIPCGCTHAPAQKGRL